MPIYDYDIKKHLTKQELENLNDFKKKSYKEINNSLFWMKLLDAFIFSFMSVGFFVSGILWNMEKFWPSMIIMVLTAISFVTQFERKKDL